MPRTPRSFTWPVGASASSDCQQPLFLSILPQSQRDLSPTIKRAHFGLSLSTFQQIVLRPFRNGVSLDQNYFSTRKYNAGKNLFLETVPNGAVGDCVSMLINSQCTSDSTFKIRQQGRRTVIYAFRQLPLIFGFYTCMNAKLSQVPLETR